MASQSVDDFMADLLSAPASLLNGLTGLKPAPLLDRSGAKAGLKRAKPVLSDAADSPILAPFSPPLAPVLTRMDTGPLAHLAPLAGLDLAVETKRDEEARKEDSDIIGIDETTAHEGAESVNATPHWAWLITHPDGRVVSATFTPRATRAEVESWYPGATIEADTTLGRTIA